MSSAHLKNCPFQIEGEQLLSLQSQKARENTVVPTYMTTVLPSDFVELMEKLSPVPILRQRVLEFESKCPASLSFPKLEIPAEIAALFQNIPNLLETTESIAILSILGWKPDGGSNSGMMLHCPLCLSCRELTLERDNASSQNDESSITTGEADTAEDNRPGKRQKTTQAFKPLDAHRHYCPYVCGFPESLSEPKVPLWRDLLSRLNKTPVEITTTDPEHSFDKIHEILRSAVAPNIVDLSAAIVEEDL